MMLDVISITRDRAFLPDLIRVLREQTGYEFDYDMQSWYKWMWKQPENRHPKYADFKGRLFGLIDEKFEGYFDAGYETTIRLDEVRWGGVVQDGIPPLRSPEMISADEADYLSDDHIVFGVSINGDHRAYPKRILAWHEMFVDTVGGLPVAGVYCTLCGTVIIYETTHNGTNHQIGTSGFLYRSNKLMYDKATQSLWSTFRGAPVIGPLVGKGIALDRRPVVTTTWGEWKSRHPETTVLSLNTGHRRDYGEGAAYSDYFSTDGLMFNTPFDDRRLNNKDQVFGIVIPGEGEPLAIHTKWLSKNPVHHDKVGDVSFVIFTDDSGAHRAYETDGTQFSEWDGANTATDSNSASWMLTEDSLTGDDGRVFNRLAANRAFWFGWFAAYNDTRLIK